MEQASAYEVATGALYGIACADLALYLLSREEGRVFFEDQAQNGLLSDCVFLPR